MHPRYIEDDENRLHPNEISPYEIYSIYLHLKSQDSDEFSKLYNSQIARDICAFLGFKKFTNSMRLYIYDALEFIEKFNNDIINKPTKMFDDAASGLDNNEENIDDYDDTKSLKEENSQIQNQENEINFDTQENVPRVLV